MERCAIDIAGISKRYGDVVALDDVSLQIAEGEIFGIVGPDGAGKSTLFRILATLADADSGHGTLLGYDLVADYRRIRSHVGYMPGVFSLYQDLTVEENIRFFASLFGNTLEECHDLIDPIYCQIEPFRRRLAGRLSGGMKQKLALCCALIHKPRIIFLDEPTTGVDAVSRRELFDMLMMLNREHGITIVVATPYREEIMCCQRVAKLDHGHVAAVGAPQDVMEQERPIVHEVRREHDVPVIEVRGLTKTFGTFTAVNRISFEVYKGEIFGFLGANGAGKTTAMRILTGLSFPTSGEGRVAGCDIRTEGEKIKRHIGYMSQRFSLYPQLTVEENMELFGGIYGMARSVVRRCIDERLQRLQCQDMRHMLVGDLPLGWKQRLAFVVATLHSPEIVFLDEPTGGVDADTRRRFWEMIYEAADGGMTVFVTTHYMDEAAYCDRVSMMVDGEIRALDTPDGLMRRYGVSSMDEVFRAIARS